MSYHDHIESIAKADAAKVIEKDTQYGGSWKKRGGSSAFHATARKWDRIETQAAKHAYDVFAAMQADTRDEGLIDDVRDLRQYLLLWEAEMVEQGVFLPPAGEEPPALGVGSDPIIEAPPALGPGRHLHPERWMALEPDDDDPQWASIVADPMSDGRFSSGMEDGKYWARSGSAYFTGLVTRHEAQRMAMRGDGIGPVLLPGADEELPEWRERALDPKQQAKHLMRSGGTRLSGYHARVSEHGTAGWPLLRAAQREALRLAGLLRPWEPAPEWEQLFQQRLVTGRSWGMAHGRQGQGPNALFWARIDETLVEGYTTVAAAQRKALEMAGITPTNQE